MNKEEVGLYRGYTYMIVVQPMGFRCGYVKIPEGHPLHGVGYSEPLSEGNEDKTMETEFDVHGGITFSGEFLEDTEALGYWIGFDCAHGDDGFDLDLMAGPEMAVASKYMLSLSPMGTVRSKEYVRSECQELIDQIIEKKKELEK